MMPDKTGLVRSGRNHKVIAGTIRQVACGIRPAVISWFDFVSAAIVIPRFGHSGASAITVRFRHAMIVTTLAPTR